MTGSPPNLHTIVPKCAFKVCSRSKSRSKVTWWDTFVLSRKSQAPRRFAIRVDSVPSWELGPARRRPRVIINYRPYRGPKQPHCLHTSVAAAAAAAEAAADAARCGLRRTPPGDQKWQMAFPGPGSYTLLFLFSFVNKAIFMQPVESFIAFFMFYCFTVYCNVHGGGITE